MSMRDIDELLNDFEDIGRKPSTSTSSLSSSSKPSGLSTSTQPGSKASKASILDDVDDLLGDLKSEEPTGYRPKSSSSSSSFNYPTSTSSNAPAAATSISVKPPQKSVVSSVSSPNPIASPKAKCVDLIVAGTEVPLGLGSITFRRACDKMRCTSCDWKVYRFEDYAWSDQTDYLFLRNNIPDFERLRPNLVPRKGNVSYACQCSWRTASSIERVDSFSSKLKWVCGGH